MSLQKQHALINFGQGIDTKTDPKLVVMGKLTSLVNGVFKKNGRIDKRNGNQILAETTLDGSMLSNASALGIFNEELLQYNKQTLYSYSENAKAWVDKGPCVSASMSSNPLVQGTSEQTQCDWAYLNGIGVYVYEDSRGGLRMTIRDNNTGALMASDVSIAPGSRPRCVTFGNLIYVFSYNAGSLYAQIVNPLTAGITLPSPLTSDVNTTNPTYDVISYENARIAIVYNMQSAAHITFGFIDGNLNSLTTTLPNTIIAEAATDCLALTIGPINTIYVSYANTSIGVRCVILNNGGAVIHAPFALDSYTSTEVKNITGFSRRDNSGVTFFYEISASNSANTLVKTAGANSNGSIVAASVFLRSVGLYSRAFSFYFNTESVDHAYVCLTHDSPLQSTYYIARNDGVVVAQMQYTTGGGLTSRPLLANVFATNSNSTIFSFPILNTFRLVSENNNLFSLQGVSQTSIDFDAQEQFNAASLGNNLHIAGGILSAYDGQSVVEHGYLLYPEGLACSQSGSAGVNTGVYNYIALYEWTDNFGQVHRSAPSIQTQFAVTSGPKNVSVVVPSLRLTRKTASAGRSEVSIVVYRSEGESGTPGLIFYRVTAVGAPTYNNPAVDTITVIDTTPDTSLISNEILYTTGGELDNIPAPSCKYISVFKNRIILAGLEVPNTVWFSKIYSAGHSVSFNNSLVINLPPQGNDITALGILDDKIVICKQDRFYITYGDGPDNTGQGQSFAPPQIVSNDVGCFNNNSIVRAPNGLMFQSLKGIYLLDSSLNVTYIGAPVEDFNSLTITAAVLKNDINQVRFTTDSNTTLVYDYYFNNWSTFGNYSVLDAAIWNETYVFIDGNGNLLYEDPKLFRDNGAGIQLSLTTGWITFDSIIGYQRIYQFSFIGEFKSDHKLRIRVAYDFSNAFTSTYIFDTAVGLGITKYGSDSPYGSGSPYGGINSSYRFAANLDVQKCQAIRFEITDLTTSASPGTGEALNISGLGLQVGIKGQVGKFRAQQQIGST